MIELARQLFTIHTPTERRKAGVVLILMVGVAILEVLGIASIMPFLAVLGNPDVVHENRYLSLAFAWFPSSDINLFLMALGVLAAIALLAAAVFRVFAHYVTFRFINMRRHSVSRRLLAGHLRQPYEFFLTRNTAELSKTILSEVDQFTNNVIAPFFDLVSYAIAACAIIFLLLVIDPTLALVVAGLLGFAYTLFYVAVRGVLGRVGGDRVVANKERFKSAAEALGGIKELKALGKERAFFDKFDPASERYSRHQATSQFLSLVPKHLIEAVGFCVIIVIALYMLGSGGALGDVLPLIGLYALAGYRLLPALQHVYRAMTKLRFGVAALDLIRSELGEAPSGSLPENRAPACMPLRHSLEVRDVSYAYPGAVRPALSHVSFEMPAFGSLGIIGQTGSGKSTLVDVMLGLLLPQSGEVLVDGHRLDDEWVRAWQQNVGYVPQEIFLVDDTVRRNIALGVPDDEIDDLAIVSAVRAANIQRFIEDELPSGYESVIGERGVRLSGGQRQRLGLARALYHDPDVLLLDEATSALDQVTEAEIMETIRMLQGRKTIILVAHRLSTIRRCDQLLRLEGGGIVGAGTFAEVVQREDWSLGLVSGKKTP